MTVTVFKTGQLVTVDQPCIGTRAWLGPGDPDRRDYRSQPVELKPDKDLGVFVRYYDENMSTCQILFGGDDMVWLNTFQVKSATREGK